MGTDVTHSDLMRRYHAVVYAVGAQTDRSLGIPGEELPGSLPATAFVGWYNGHPDFRDLAPDLSHETAVVIGNGNVAADVARLLTRDPDELARTDVADHALAALRESAVRRVIVLGRRGPAQAAFTNAELRELGRMAGVEVVVEPAEAELDPVSDEWLAEEGTFTARRNVERLQEYAAAERDPSAGRTIELRFLRSPAAIRGTDHVEGIDVVTNEITPRRARRAARAAGVGCDGDDPVRARPALRGLPGRAAARRAVRRALLRAPERPRARPRPRDGRADPRRVRGRLDQARPDGILGTNKRDAEETVRALVEDLHAGRLNEPVEDGAVEDLLRARRRRDRCGLVGDRPPRAGGRRGGRAPAGEAGGARRAARGRDGNADEAHDQRDARDDGRAGRGPRRVCSRTTRPSGRSPSASAADAS